MDSVAILLGVLMGSLLGLLGGGGSILTVPIFVYVLGIEAKPAIAMSLAVVGATAFLGVWSHGRAGHVNLRVAAVFAPVAMAGTYLGARLAIFFSGQAQLLLFAGVMLLASYFMARRPAYAKAVGPLPTEPPPPIDRTRGGTAIAALPLLIAEGLGVGVLTGLVGAGGGFLIVPALVLMSGLDMKEAIGTSLLVIALKSAAGFWGYLDQVSIDWTLTVSFTAASAAGILLGARIARWIPAHTLRRGFAVFLMVMAVGMLFVEGIR